MTNAVLERVDIPMTLDPPEEFMPLLLLGRGATNPILPDAEDRARLTLTGSLVTNSFVLRGAGSMTPRAGGGKETTQEYSTGWWTNYDSCPQFDSRVDTQSD